MDDNVSYITEDSSDYLLFYGNGFLKEKLPKGTRVIHPKKPIPGLNDPKKEIDYALEHPLGRDPLSKVLKKGMKITIAFDDISIPLPGMVSPDLRQLAIEVILEKLDIAGISDVHLIGALGLHRKMTKSEIKKIVGKKIFNKYWPNRLYNFDPENMDEIKNIGHTEQHEHLCINKRAAESDLLIYVNINFTSMDGGHKSMATGLCNYESIKHHHNVDSLKKSCLFDPADSLIHDRISRQGKIIEEKVKTFHLEMAINNQIFPSYLGLLSKNPDKFNFVDKIMSNVMAANRFLLPESIRRSIFRSIKSNYKLIGVYSGEVDQVHNKILELNYKQSEVEVEGQSDIVLYSVSDIGPYNVNSILNPLLFVCLVHGYYFNFYKTKPLVKKGGVLIATYPLDDKFDHKFHPSYVDFYNNILSKTTNHLEIEKKYEKDFAYDKKYIDMYRNGNAYHGVHPFYMWYWAVAGLNHVGKTIVVKPKSKKVLDVFGFDSASSVKEAVKKARDYLKNGEASISYLKVPPIITVKVK